MQLIENRLTTAVYMHQLEKKPLPETYIRLLGKKLIHSAYITSVMLIINMGYSRQSLNLAKICTNNIKYSGYNNNLSLSLQFLIVRN